MTKSSFSRSPHTPPHIEIVAGPNGSGKSTFAESFLIRTRGSSDFLNPDIIAAGFGSSDFERASFQAGRILIREVRHRIFFIYLKGVSHNLERIKKRVRNGGLDIPATVVRRRHLRCFENFWDLYRPLCDSWYILDNSARVPELIQSSESFTRRDVMEQEAFATRFRRGKVRIFP